MSDTSVDFYLSSFLLLHHLFHPLSQILSYIYLDFYLVHHVLPNTHGQIQIRKYDSDDKCWAENRRKIAWPLNLRKETNKDVTESSKPKVFNDTLPRPPPPPKKGTRATPVWEFNFTAYMKIGTNFVTTYRLDIEVYKLGNSPYINKKYRNKKAKQCLST